MTNGFKQDIRERAGVGSSGFLYRGADAEETREILDRRVVSGSSHPVWWVDNTPEEIGDTRARSVESLEVVDKLTISVAGGLSSSLGGAQKFSQSLSELGVVLVFDPANVDPMPEPITYELEWFDDNAGLAARVASLVDGEVRTAEDDKLRGLVRDDGVIDSTGRGNLELKFSTPMYTDEQEWFSISDALNVDGAVVGAVTVAHTQRAVGGSVQGALAEFPGFKMGFAGGSQRDVTAMSNEDRAAALHELLTDTAGLWAEVSTPYYVLLMDDDRWKQGAGVDADEFLLAYDGEEAITNRDRLPNWLPL